MDPAGNNQKRHRERQDASANQALVSEVLHRSICRIFARIAAEPQSRRRYATLADRDGLSRSLLRPNCPPSRSSRAHRNQRHRSRRIGEAAAGRNRDAKRPRAPRSTSPPQRMPTDDIALKVSRRERMRYRSARRLRHSRTSAVQDAGEFQSQDRRDPQGLTGVALRSPQSALSTQRTSWKTLCEFCGLRGNVFRA